MLIAHVLQMSC